MKYRERLTVAENRKGVLDVDTVKGCTEGMKAHPTGGCYGQCYANRIAIARGLDFTQSVSRPVHSEDIASISSIVRKHKSAWFRIGTMGDPCHDWQLTLDVCRWLGAIKTPIIVTKHWNEIETSMLLEFARCNAVFNTSISAMDAPDEIQYRLDQHKRLKGSGIRSVLRIVTCKFGNTENGRRLDSIQRVLFSNSPIIDNPFRVPSTDDRVVSGDILVERHEDLGGGSSVSIAKQDAHVGPCCKCKDKCGVALFHQARKRTIDMSRIQGNLFSQNYEFKCVESVIGSGFEDDIAVLAIEDGIACRAARKNMQIHSAVILEIDGAFAGFMTFQDNKEVGEFCLLQSVIKPEFYTPELYREMVVEVLAQNKDRLPALITTDPKSKFETPALFEGLGFVTYLKMSGFHYMINGDIGYSRFKLLAHITMTNVWNSIKGDWLRLKKEWKAAIESAGETHGIINPAYATRDGCWQGSNGYSNVVLAERTVKDGKVVCDKGRSHNGNASVLDPVACEVILRFFMPSAGGRVYNPFGGGVQFGFVSGHYGYEYVASEIRQNQCDANNKLCSDFECCKWVQSDSSTYHPEGTFDLIFSCPPYYKVEKYLDYDGNPPEGEINSMQTYDEFMVALFKGYEIAIDHLNDNRFIAIMIGDSRGKDGAYHCAEAETELFLKGLGLKVYNRIVYLECEFTRLAHAKKTLNYRKFPKREQKIIIAYKGDTTRIKDEFPSVGRL